MDNPICEFCGKELTEETTCSFDETLMCPDCMENETVICSDCGDRIWSENACGDSDRPLCEACYEHYVHCERCGRMIHQDDAEYEGDCIYCFDCYEDMEKCTIRNYGYKPDPVFYGRDELYYGVELEIDKGGEFDENAQTLLNLGNQREERIYCKHDGSLDDGFEIVSHPMTLAYHAEQMNWQELFEKAVDMNYRSHQTSTCGLHIHVNRDAFSDEAIGRIVYFVEHHWNELVRFSRRNAENLNRWAARYATISETAQETYKKAKDKRMGRYVAVNLENEATIEFRLFRGTLRYQTFLATLQLIDSICRFAIEKSDRESEETSWSDFMRSIPEEKEELIAYLKERGIYVNEWKGEDEACADCLAS